MQEKENDLSRVDGYTSTDQQSELPQHATSLPETTAPERKYRIWTLYCPFKKSGFPSVGNFGSQINQVVIIDVKTWSRMCAEIPALATAQFEVGTDE